MRHVRPPVLTAACEISSPGVWESSSLTRDQTQAPCIGSVEAEPLVPQRSPESSLSSFQGWDLATATSSLLPVLSQRTVSVHTSHVLHARLSPGCHWPQPASQGPHTETLPSGHRTASNFSETKPAVLHVRAQEV